MDVFLFVWENIAAITGSILLTTITGMLGIFLRWHKESKDDRILAHNAHSDCAKIHDLVKKINQRSLDQQDQLQQMQQSINLALTEEAHIKNTLDVVNSRGPRDVLEHIGTIQKQLTEINIRLQSGDTSSLSAS